jgi:hypothetical protein
MKNMTPVILVMLMLTSFLAGMDIHELEEQVVIEETGARSGADASVIAITTPKESTCNIQGCRNTLQVGEEVSFSAFIKNVGDADITDLSYTVTVYLTDSNQAVGGVAKNAQGNDLIWENLDVMCDDASVCDYDSTTDPLSAGAFLGGGKVTLQRSGADIVWTPTQGEYMVEIAVDSPIDADTSNDAELVYVIVEDWYDISVDLAWIDGATGEEMETSSLDASSLQSGQFKLTVTADGSNTFSPREVNIRMETSGQVDTASLSDGTDVKGISYITMGTVSNVEIYQNETDPNATQMGNRAIMTYQTAYEMSGELYPTGDANAQFEITAEVHNYTLYGQYDDCVESSDATEGDENVTTWNNFCEVLENNDDRPKTDYDELTGSKVTYDDIRISRMGIYQGYNSDCTGVATTFMQEGEDGDLNVGCSLLYADVEHRGSDPTKAYGWNVSYSVALDGTPVASGTLVECTVGLEVPYVYSPLGGGAPVGSVCMQTTLEPGEYTFTMELAMNNKSSTDTDPVPWSGGIDQRDSNNDATMVVDVINNLPVITSFELTTEGDIVVGQEAPLVFAVSAFDVDDPSGEGLNFAYSYPGGEIGGCTGSQSEGATVCTTPVFPDFIGNSPVTVVVTDSHNGEVSKEIDMFVWNSAVATATTSTSGVEVQYSLDYSGQSEFTIATFEDADASSYEAVQLEGFTGTYAAVGAIDYAPSTTYTASDVLDQSISVILAKDVEATSLWYIDGSGKWILLSDASTDVDASTEMFTYDVPDNSPVVPAGKMVLMGGELAQASIPDASVSGFSAEATKGGAIAMTWDITGTLLGSDSITVNICADAADCTDGFEATVADEDRTYTYSGSQTTHGVTYHLEVAVCNEQGCSTPGISSVVADKQVDGGVAASNLAVAAQDGQWVITWEVTGDSSDVAMWHVCWANEDFTVGEMPMPCPAMAMGADATTLTIDMPSIRTGQEYFFTAVPMDALGNMDAAASMNSIIDTRAADNTNSNDGNGTIGDTGDDASSSVPTWTWGLIGGVVIVAFIAGAFILSRGDGEDGEGKDWDY